MRKIQKLALTAALALSASTALASGEVGEGKCRNVNEMSPKTVIQFDSQYRMMDFCADQEIERLIMSNQKDWLIEVMEPPRVDGVNGFFTIRPNYESKHQGDNNVILYLDDGTRREFWLTKSERKELVKGFENAFYQAVEAMAGDAEKIKASQAQ